MKHIICFFLLSNSFLVYAESKENFSSFLNSKNKSLKSILCSDSLIVDQRKYCVYESKITLNSCGKNSDWPCLEAEGCLEIKKYVHNDQE
jgi:hypothetical protein